MRMSRTESNSGKRPPSDYGGALLSSDGGSGMLIARCGDPARSLFTNERAPRNKIAGVRCGENSPALSCLTSRRPR